VSDGTGVRDPDHWDTTACSVNGDALGEPAYGTASVARGWVALEQPGPWGRAAATDSHLDAEVGKELSERIAAANGRFVLIRGTGQHADDHVSHRRRVLVSSCVPEQEWLLTGTVSDPRELAALDVAAVVRGDRDAALASMPKLAPSATPVFLVCTNGRRDVCCAVRGRPVAHDAAAQRTGQVWETSHTGGHRFAPTGVLLPSGVTLARVHGDDVVAALDAAAEQRLVPHLFGPRHDRGRSAFSAVEQAAESVVRALTGEQRLDGLRVDAVTPGADSPVTVTRLAADGAEIGRWHVTVRRERRLPDRPVSCHKPAEEQSAYAVEVVEA
jgi:hypothetical protein